MQEVTQIEGDTSANEEHDITDENARLLRNCNTGTGRFFDVLHLDRYLQHYVNQSRHLQIPNIFFL